MSAKAATGIGTSVDVSPYQQVSVVIAGSALADLTVKCKGSFLMSTDTNLDFSAAQSVTNLWDTIAMYDLQNGGDGTNPGTIIAGDTGIVFTGSADVRQFILNTDGLRTINFDVTARVAGNVSVFAFPIQ